MNVTSPLLHPTYFITLCAYQSQPLLGKLTAGRVVLTEAGRIAENSWLSLPEHMPEVQLDAFIVMPNHFHGILMLDDRGRQAQLVGPNADRRQLFTDHRPLSTVLRGFKAAATNRVNHLNDTPGASLWQPGYHARVVKSQPALEAFRRYIRDNPADWQSDPLNPNGDRPAPFCPVPLAADSR